MPDSLMAFPKKKLKNKGDAEGNKRQRTIQAIISKANFSWELILFLFLEDLITIALKSFGIINLTRKG